MQFSKLPSIFTVLLSGLDAVSSFALDVTRDGPLLPREPMTDPSHSLMPRGSKKATIHGKSFWAGATISTLYRQEAIRGREYYDFDGKTLKNPFKTLADSKVNAIRVETGNGQCLGPTKIVHPVDEIKAEMGFVLDWGCIDAAVKTAVNASKLGMQVELTINIGNNISAEWRDLNYAQLAGKVQEETTRQLKPFLAAKLVPDVILFENEGTMGYLAVDNTTGHTRGLDDGKASKEQVDKELCGEIPNGRMGPGYAQLAGFYKAQVIACNKAVTAAGLDKSTVRYGLHTHGQYVDGKEANVHGPDYYSETKYTTPSGKVCDFTKVIPEELLNHKASDVLDIMGFSIRLNSITPTDVNSLQSMEDTFGFLNTTLQKLDAISHRYGKWNSGPFKGQYKKQALVVEYESAFPKPEIPQQQIHTQKFWSIMKSFDNVLGALWYEPWGCFSYFVGGTTALCTTGANQTNSWEIPTDTMKTWGEAAVSPRG